MLVPDYMRDRPLLPDPTLAQPLADQGLLHRLNPETLVDQQTPVRFDVDGDELVLDLLLFNVEELRYVVVELKSGKFDPGYVGQLGTYVAVVDDRLRRSDRHAPTVGILLCKGRNDTLVRYALAGASAPLAVADYTYDTLPAQERSGLPTAAELTAALEQPAPPAGPEPHERNRSG